MAGHQFAGTSQNQSEQPARKYALRSFGSTRLSQSWSHLEMKSWLAASGFIPSVRQGNSCPVAADLDHDFHLHYRDCVPPPAIASPPAMAATVLHIS